MKLTPKEQVRLDKLREISWSLYNVSGYSLQTIGEMMNRAHNTISHMCKAHEAKNERIQKLEKEDWDFIYKHRELLREALKHFEDEPPC